GNLDPQVAGHLPDRPPRTHGDLVAVDLQRDSIGGRYGRCRCAHPNRGVYAPRSPASLVFVPPGTLPGKCLSIERIGLRATWPRPQIDVWESVSPSSERTDSSAAGTRPRCTASRSSVAWWLPARQGTHLPHDSLRKNETTFVASAKRSVP